MSARSWLFPLSMAVVFCSSATFADADEPSNVVIPHTSGPKYAAALAKLDNPKPEKEFRHADEEDHWKFSIDQLKGPFEDFKKALNIASDAKLTVDGDSFQAEWFEYVKSKDFAGAFSSPEFFCKYFWENELPRKVATSKSCMAKIAKLKGFKCAISTKQDKPMKVVVAAGNVLVLTVHNNHEANSEQYDSGMFEEMGKALPECAKALNR